MMADRQIRWALMTQFRSGAYNSTFPFQIAQSAFNLIAEFFQLGFPRVNSGETLRLVQSNQNKNAAAWQSGNSIFISPNFNFGGNPRLAAKVLAHEFGHWGNGSNHSRDPEAIMSENTGTSNGWTPDDLRWFGKYRLRGAMPPRGIFSTRFGMQVAYGDDGEAIEKIPLGCGLSQWGLLVDRLRPVYPVKRGVFLVNGKG